MIETLATALHGTLPEFRVNVIDEQIHFDKFVISANLRGQIILDGDCGNSVIVGKMTDPIVFITTTIRRNVNFCC